MSTVEQRGYIDFLAGGDTGTNTVDAIQPVDDGEPGNANTFRRPSENLRSRTVIVQEQARDLLYYRDAGHLAIEAATGSTVTWAGDTDHAASGKITQVGDLTIRPMLTPKVSKKGSRRIGTLGVNSVLYAVQATGYASMGLDQVTVEHRNTGAALVTVTISSAPIKHILVEFDAGNPTHDAPTTVAAVNAAIGAELLLNTYLLASTTDPAGAAIAASSPVRVEGTFDQEAHTLPSGLLTTFTNIPGNELADGDCIAIWYRYVVEPGFPPAILPGGRWESNPDRGSSTIPLAALFITSDNPENIPGAVPVCKSVNNILVWCDGSRTAPGTTGPVGTVSAADVTVDVTSFKGPPTNVVNGGIDTALAPATIQEALESVDTRLSQLRTAWVCTDGVTTTGGHFNGTNAITSAISTLGAIGGTLLVRRGLYTLPNAYVFPAGVVIVTDGPVIMAQAAPVALSISTQCEFRGTFAFLCGGIEITTGLNVLMDNVAITGRLQISSGFVGRRIAVNGTAAPASYSVRFTGDNATVENLTVSSHSVTFTGSNCAVRTLRIENTPAALGSSVVSMYGGRCIIENLSIQVTTNITAATALLEISGANNTVNVAYIESTGSPITAGRYGVWLNGCIGATLNNVSMLMGAGVPLKIGFTVTATIDSSLFSSLSGTEHVIDTSAVTATQQNWNFRNCKFSQNGNTSSRMLSLANIIGSSLIEWDNCEFRCARLNSYMLQAQGMQFYNCLFSVQNPAVLGAVRLGGVVNAQTQPLFQFYTGSTARDCVIDANNAEVNNNAGRPDFDASLFCSVQKATVENLKIININRQMYSVNEYSSLVDLREGATLNGLVTEFTGTASVQGGLQKLDAAVTFNVSNVVFTDYIIETTANWPGTATVCYPCAVGAESGTVVTDVRVKRVRVLDFYAGICQDDFASARNLGHSSFEDCVFGVETVSGCTNAIGVPLPAGFDVVHRNCTYVHIGGLGAGLFTLTFGVGPDYKLIDCYAIANAAEDAAVGIFHGVGVGASMSNFYLVGNTFRTTATAALVKPFYTGVGAPESATTNVGAGNKHYYSGGSGTTPPTFSANINAW